MSQYVIDTQALVKLLNGKKVINDTIDRILQETEEGMHTVIIPAVALFEIGYLHEKGRISISLQDIRTVLTHSINYVEEPLSLPLIETAFEITDIPELHDRLIAGTSRFLHAPILTNDPVILNSRFVECVTEDR